MSTTLITKNALANALKLLMIDKPIYKITISMVVNKCGVTRHTFYNHFHDVYELLGWIFENEVIDELDECCSLSRWKEGVHIVLKYTYNNKSICINTYKSIGREHLEMFLHKTFIKVLEGVIEDINTEKKVDDKLKKDISLFFSYAITGEFLQWINNDLNERKEDIADRIELMMDGTILRIINTNSK